MGAGLGAPTPESMIRFKERMDEALAERDAYNARQAAAQRRQDALYARRKAFEEEFAAREAERHNKVIIDGEFKVISEE